MTKTMREMINLVESISKASDQGFDIDAYHGTNADFDEFDPERSGGIGMHFGTVAQANTVSRSILTGQHADGANIIPVKLRMKTPLRVYDVFSTLRTTYIFRAKLFTLDTKGFNPSQEERSQIYAAAKFADKMRRKAGGEWGVLDKNKDEQQKLFTKATSLFWKSIETSAIRQGYDGFVYQNRVEGKGDSYVVFDPKNIRVRHANFDPEKSNSNKLLDDVNES